MTTYKMLFGEEGGGAGGRRQLSMCLCVLVCVWYFYFLAVQFSVVTSSSASERAQSAHACTVFTHIYCHTPHTVPTHSPHTIHTHPQPNPPSLIAYGSLARRTNRGRKSDMATVGEGVHVSFKAYSSVPDRAASLPHPAHPQLSPAVQLQPMTSFYN